MRPSDKNFNVHCAVPNVPPRSYFINYQLNDERPYTYEIERYVTRPASLLTHAHHYFGYLILTSVHQLIYVTCRVKYVRFILTRIKGKGGFTTVHYFLGFLGKWLTKGGCFKPETIRTTREIIPHHFSYLGLVVLEKLMNKQTNT